METSKKCLGRVTGLVAGLAVATAASMAAAASTVTYQYGFEDNVQPSTYTLGSTTVDYDGTGFTRAHWNYPGAIDLSLYSMTPDAATPVLDARNQLVASGGGTLHLTAPEGGHYMEAYGANDPGPGAWLGQQGYPAWQYADNPAATNNLTYPGEYFTATTVYIDPANWTPITDRTLILDQGANTVSGNGNEMMFQLTHSAATPGEITISGINGGAFNGKITHPGWYTFATDYIGHPGPGDAVFNFYVVDKSLNGIGSLVASLLHDSTQNISYDHAGVTLANELADSSYWGWLIGGQGAIPSNLIGVDNIQYGSGTFLEFIPEPASLVLLGLSGMMACGRRRK